MNAALDTTLRFGTQLIVNPEDTAQTMRACLATLDQAGFKLIRLFMMWSLIEPQPGRFNWSPYEDIFDEAHARKIKIVATLFSASPPAWMGLTRGMYAMADLDDPALAARSSEYVRKVVERFRDHPALDSWILWNEPSRGIAPSNPHAVKNFRRFIADCHDHDLATYNAAHFNQISSFDEAEPGNVGLGDIAFGSYRTKIEWIQFAVHDLQSKLAGLAAEVRALDESHPIHVNPHQLGMCIAQGGQSIWKEASIVDFMGCSAHAPWHSVRFPRHRYSASIALFADLTRSASLAPDHYFWVTELQGGTTLLSGFRPLAPAPEEARVWLWQCIGAGARAVIYWGAHARTAGYEAGEWDLLDLRGRPTRRLDMISKTIRGLEPYLRTLSTAKPSLPDVGVIVSEPSFVLDLVEGKGDDPKNPRNQQRGMDAVCGAYLMAADLSLETSFYDLERLRATPLETLPPILIAPSLTVVDRQTVEYLEKAVHRGCLLIGDGFFAWKDPYGKLAEDLYPAADSLWGACCCTYEALEEGASFQDASGASQRGWFVRAMLEPTTAQADSSWPDGVAAITRHQIGEGAACRIGTSVFQRYLTETDAGALALFHRLIAGSLQAKVRLENGGAELRLRRLRAGDMEIGVLINSGAHSVTARLVSPDGRSASFAVPQCNAIILSLDTLSILGPGMSA